MVRINRRLGCCLCEARGDAKNAAVGTLFGGGHDASDARVAVCARSVDLSEDSLRVDLADSASGSLRVWAAMERWRARGFRPTRKTGWGQLSSAGRATRCFEFASEWTLWH